MDLLEKYQYLDIVQWTSRVMEPESTGSRILINSIRIWMRISTSFRKKFTTYLKIEFKSNKCKIRVNNLYGTVMCSKIINKGKQFCCNCKKIILRMKFRIFLFSGSRSGFRIRIRTGSINPIESGSTTLRTSIYRYICLSAT
jgi:hypothetical protein